MHLSRFLSDWDNLERNNLSLKLVVVLLACGLIVESVYMLRMVMDERIVLVPANLDKRAWVSAHDVSMEYLESLALDALPYYTNFTPQTVTNSHYVFLRYVTSDAYGKTQTALSAEADQIRRDNVSQVFWPKNTEINPTQMLVTVHGILKRTIGNVTAYEGSYTYRISFVRNGTQLEIKGIEHVAE
jgi:type IV conjugative transfer system protein TraE